MPEPPHPAGDGGAEFIRRIVSDPKNVPDVMLLYGYLGASSEEAHERLYLSPDLSNYVEVPRASILHQAQAAREQDPHGAATLWVKKDAALKYRMSPAQQAAQEALAYYFAGAIQGRAAAAAAAPVAPRPTVLQQCGPPTIVGAACPQSQVGPCPSRFGTCGATCAQCPPTAAASCGCTNVVVCPTLNCHTFYPCTHICPTHGATCAPNATCHFMCTRIFPCSGALECSMTVCPTEPAGCTHNCAVNPAFPWAG